MIEHMYEDTKEVVWRRLSIWFDLLCLMPLLSAIFQLYHVDQL